MRAYRTAGSTKRGNKEILHTFASYARFSSVLFCVYVGFGLYYLASEAVFALLNSTGFAHNDCPRAVPTGINIATVSLSRLRTRGVFVVFTSSTRRSQSFRWLRWVRSMG